MAGKLAWAFLFACLMAILLVIPWQPSFGTELQVSPPRAKQAPGPSPSASLEKRAPRAIPELRGIGSAARSSAMAFLESVASSGPEEADVIRKHLVGARQNHDIAQAFCDAGMRARATDHTRALLALALLGEMKSPVGEDCFTRFLDLPLPQKGTVVEGEILEQTALATLQAKAVDGLAYARTPRTDEQVLKLAGSHPSRIVRAEAIDAYLWNHGDSEEAKATLRRYVKKEEQIFIDRVRRNSGEQAESFNRKLELFLKAHPELMPPAPEKLKEAAAPEREQPELSRPPKY